MKYIGLFLLTSLLTTELHSHDFAPFDNGLNDFETYKDKVAVLKELGYTGTTWRPGNTQELLNELDKADLKLYATYVVLRATPEECPIPQAVIDEIRVLRGRDTFVWLTIVGETSDEIALEAIRTISAFAKVNDLRVALYPHSGFKVDTVATSLRFAKLINEPHVGVSFNLCHFLKQNDEADLEATLQAAAPNLFLVSVNGADRGDTQSMNWDQLIQPLGEGSFDTSRVLNLLETIHYKGPILLQCYNIDQPDKIHLQKSMTAWKRVK
jgi:sugar phosphate isomerase/epimerase